MFLMQRRKSIKRMRDFSKRTLFRVNDRLINLGNQDLVKYGQRNFDKITDNRKMKRAKENAKLDSDLKLTR